MSKYLDGIRAKNAAKTRNSSVYEVLRKKTVSALDKLIWAECRRIKQKERAYCYTCNQANLTGSNKQLGHYYPKGALGAKMKHDLRILRWQCFRCNIHMGGMGGVFRENMMHEIGMHEEQLLFNECDMSKSKPIKARDFYIERLLEYRGIK